MPSLNESTIAAQLPGLDTHFGVAATYTDPAGSIIAGLTIRIHRNEHREVPRENRASGQLQTGEIRVQQALLGQVSMGGRFTIEQVEVWTVETTPTLKNGEFMCMVKRSGLDSILSRRAKE
jgi:hypothetical protein